jgi:hypothetical protein
MCSRLDEDISTCAYSPEWTIQRASEFCGIAHQRAPIPQPFVYQPSFDSLDSSVHHITRCDAISAVLSVTDCDFRNTFYGWFCVYCTLGREDTAVTMRSIFTEADITCNVEGREERTKLFDGKNYGTFWVICWGATIVLKDGGWTYYWFD